MSSKSYQSRRSLEMVSPRKKNIPHSLPPLNNQLSLSATPNDRQRLIPGSPAPQSMREAIPSGHSPSRRRRNMPQSPQISVSPVEDDDDDFDDEEDESGGGRSSIIGIRNHDKIVELKGIKVGISDPFHEIESRSFRKEMPRTPMPHKGRSHRSLPSSGGSISSISSSEGRHHRPPTSLSVLSASSMAEVTKTIRERHSSMDGGLSPPPRVVSLEDSRGFKVMTELVNPEVPYDEKATEEQRPKNLSSKYAPLKPISPKRK